MYLPGRKYDAGSGYRYGFNGKENDKDAGEGIQDYGMRIYSERLGKFLSKDPITAFYPMLTPYQFASNTPIQAVDLDGLEGVKIVNHNTHTVTIRVNVIYVVHKVNSSVAVTHNSPQNLLKAIDKEIAKVPPSDLIDDETGYAVNFLFSTEEYPSLKEAEEYIATVSNDIYNSTQFFDLVPEETKTIMVKDQNGNEIESDATTVGRARWRHLFFTSTRNSHNVTHEFWHNFTHNHVNAPSDIKTEIDPKDQEPGHFKAGGIFQRKNDALGRDLLPLNKKNIKDALRSLPKIEIKEVGGCDDPRKADPERTKRNDSNA